MGNSIRNTREIEQALGLDADNILVTKDSSNKVDTLDIEVFKSDGATCATGISWSVSPEGTSNTVEVTLTMQDGVNSTVNDVQQVILWLSGNATGEGLVSSTASGALTVTAGTQLGVLTAKKALVCLTNDSGQLTFTVEDSATGAFYPSAFRPLTGRVDTGSQVVSGNYN